MQTYICHGALKIDVTYDFKVIQKYQHCKLLFITGKLHYITKNGRYLSLNTTEPRGGNTINNAFISVMYIWGN